jgi:hypothetical protein
VQVRRRRANNRLEDYVEMAAANCWIAGKAEALPISTTS